jgi:hypothetical protein
VGGQSEPKAALYLQLAKENMDRGKSLANKGEKDAAAAAYMRAESDAEVSLAVARSAQSKMQAQQAIDKLKTLKEGGTP